MKSLKIIVITIIGLCASPSLWAVDCTTASFQILQTQAAVDSFQTDYGPCDTVVGTLLVRNSDITNLNGLSAIVTVTVELKLSNLDSLPNLSAISNVSSIVKLTVDDNQLLTDLSGLVLVDLGDITITDNPNLTSLTGLDNLTQISNGTGEILIDSNPQLATLSALSNLQTGLNTIQIRRNNLLADLTGLSGVKGSIIKLSVTNNTGLQSLNGMGNISNISTDLFIFGNTQLADVSVLSGLTTIGEDFDFEDTLMTHMDDFANLNSLSGSLRVKNHSNLQNIDGLSSLLGTLDILEVRGNDVLENIDGLMGITHTQSQVQIISNLALLDIKGLSSLQAVDGSFNIQNNPMLSDCTAVVTLIDDFDDFATGPGPGGAGIPDIAGNIFIDNNQVSCNSVQEILDSVAVMYVDINTIADSSCAIGECWNHAHTNLQDALAAATNSTNIWLAQGVYYAHIGGDQGAFDFDEEATFILSAGVSIYGGFVGTETDFSQRDVTANVTILSGDVDENDNNDDGNFIAETVGDISGNNSYSIVNGEDADNNTHLDGVTITAANTDAATNAGESSSGIYCSNVQSGLGISQVVFIGNNSIGRGGAMYGCAHNVNQSLFINNKSGSASTAGNGGAIFSFGGTIKNSEFISNNSNIAGAIRNSAAVLRITNTKFIGNSVNNFLNNKGGAIWTASDVFIENSLFSGNRAGTSSNDNGGALFLQGSSNAHLINVTFTGNRAGDTGGAIGSSSTGTLTLDNTIVWNNQDSNGLGAVTASIDHPNGTTLINNSLVQAFDPSGTSNLDTDPSFILETDPTTAPTNIGNAHLTNGSPAIDTGNNTVVTELTDLDNLQRIRNSIVDMGAYEFFEEQVFKDGFE